MKRNIKINILLCLTSIILSTSFVVIILEVKHYLKHKEILNQFWHDPNTQFDPKLGWSPIPSRSLNIPNWGTISSNSHGFRSAEINQNKKQIIVLGDSVTWGFGVSDTETFPYYLDKMISQSGYQVSNLAISGYGIDQYYLFLKRHIEKFKDLQIVVLGICTGNDLLNTSSNF
ncbi:MAG: SGNH/GDSL hydrolase family protein, partial [Candidatus Melainabacteria bacterium]|nr:SGNH/GDSL hydrolase family protein [Candidatus Melainabacteria bacterium]